MGATAREPSMEDILASIRKIVSQDASAAPSAPAAAAAPRAKAAEPAQTPAVVQPSPPANGFAAPKAQAAARQSFADFARNVTGTEKNENGAGSKIDASESPLKPALAGHSEGAANGAARPPSLSGLLKSVRESWPQPAGREPAPRPPAAHAAPAPAAPAPHQDPFGGEMPALDRRIGQEAEKLPIERRAHPASAVGAGQTVVHKAASAEPSSNSEATRFKEALVSPGAQQSVTASLDRLKQGVMSGLDARVETLLRPMLKEWLDNNLPDMVEKMVRAEIDRIVREAEQK